MISEKEGYQYLKFLGLVVGQPFLEGAQEVKNAAAAIRIKNNTVIFFMLRGYIMD